MKGKAFGFVSQKPTKPYAASIFTLKRQEYIMFVYFTLK